MPNSNKLPWWRGRAVRLLCVVAIASAIFAVAPHYGPQVSRWNPYRAPFKKTTMLNSTDYSARQELAVRREVQKKIDEARAQFRATFAHYSADDTVKSEGETRKPGDMLGLRYSKSDLHWLAAMIDGEAAGEPHDGQILAGYVGERRAFDNKTTVKAAVCARRKNGGWEFDGAKKACIAYGGGSKLPPASENSLAIARYVLAGKYQPPKELAKVRFFMNVDASSDGGIVWFARKTKFKKPIGNHWFAEERLDKRKVYHAKRTVKRGPIKEADVGKPKLFPMRIPKVPPGGMVTVEFHHAGG